jgi:hypothetical protein
MSKVDNLPIPPEPVEVKKYILEAKSMLGKESDIDWEPLAAWAGNKIPSYLWKDCKWKNILTAEGFTWQSFLRLLKYRTEDMILWMNGHITWVKFVEVFKKSINGPLGQSLKRS